VAAPQVDAPRLYIFAASPARDACRIGQASDSLRGTRARLAANDMHGIAGVAKGSLPRSERRPDKTLLLRRSNA
jgi:hypothetical protein